MHRFLAASAGALVAVLLAGCGSTTSDVELGPPATGQPRVAGEPDGAGRPTWGACREHSMQITDYASDATGARTRVGALASYRVAGDHVVDRLPRPHRNAQVLLVGDDNVIHHAIELLHTEHGWLVSMVEACA